MFLDKTTVYVMLEKSRYYVIRSVPYRIPDKFLCAACQILNYRIGTDLFSAGPQARKKRLNPNSKHYQH